MQEPSTGSTPKTARWNFKTLLDHVQSSSTSFANRLSRQPSELPTHFSSSRDGLWKDTNFRAVHFAVRAVNNQIRHVRSSHFLTRSQLIDKTVKTLEICCTKPAELSGVDQPDICEDHSYGPASGSFVFQIWNKSQGLIFIILPRHPTTQPPPTALPS